MLSQMAGFPSLLWVNNFNLFIYAYAHYIVSMSWLLQTML